MVKKSTYLLKYNSTYLLKYNSTYSKKLLYLSRSIYLTHFNYASKEFEEAKNRLGTLKEDPGNDIKLKMYALFKQVNPYNHTLA